MYVCIWLCMYVHYVSEICAEGMFESFPQWLRIMWKVGVKNIPFFKWAPVSLKFNFQKRKQLGYNLQDTVLHVTITFSVKQSKGKQEQAADPFNCP